MAVSSMVRADLSLSRFNTLVLLPLTLNLSWHNHPIVHHASASCCLLVEGCHQRLIALRMISVLLAGIAGFAGVVIFQKLLEMTGLTLPA